MIDINNLYTKRSGVIPYVIMNGHTYFLLGKDRKTKELTDFGGTSKKKERAIISAMREFREETNNIFDTMMYDYHFLQEYFIVTDYNENSIFFVRIDENGS